MYSDYVFISKNGHALAEESLRADRVGEFAQTLARRHRTTVTPYIVAGDEVEPDKCPTCGEHLPEIGPCWSCLYPEEEVIPFMGEPMQPRIITEQDEYF